MQLGLKLGTKNTNYTENKSFLPFIVATTLFSLILISSVNAGSWENTRIVIVSLGIWLVWFASFVVEKMKGRHIADKKSQCVIKTLIAVTISLFFANTIWFCDYLTLNPISAILNGQIHFHRFADPLFHSTIAESIKNYGYPSILLNDAGFLNYHIGSHFILAQLSKILNIPAFLTYNYIYPIVCLPIYSYLLVSVIVEIRKYKGEKVQLSVIDYIFMLFFFAGFFPADFLRNIGIWKNSWIASESFLFSLIFFLLYLLLVFKIVSTSHKWRNILIVLLTAIFIFICSSMKISVGFLLLAGAMYMNFRLNMRKLQYWLVNVMFLSIFIVYYIAFSGDSAAGGIQWQPFSFIRNTFGQEYLRMGLLSALHYFYLMFFILLILYYQSSANKPLKSALTSKKMIVEETLLVVALLSLIPGILLVIPGGSAVYFSYFPELVAICIFLGYNIPERLLQKTQIVNVMFRKGIKYGLYILFFFGCISIYYKTVFSFDRTVKSAIYALNNSEENSLFSNIREINKISKSEKIKYGIFIDDNAEMWKYFEQKSPRVAVFFYPALTGIRVLNAVYTDGVSVFASNGARIQELEQGIYGISKNIVADSNPTLDEVKEMARNRNIEYIIYLYGDKYQIIKVGDI